MAITRIGAAGANATTITIPVGHQTGDLIVMFSYNGASLTIPSIPTGWTNLNSVGSSTQGFRWAYKLAISSSDTSGTWTNATDLACAVYRNISTVTPPSSPIGPYNTGTSTTVMYLSLTPVSHGGSWLIFAVGKASNDSTIETAPTNTTNIADNVGVSTEIALHDTNGIFRNYTGNGIWPTTNVSVGGTSSNWCTAPLEIFAEQLGNLNNYQQLKVSDGMSVGEKIR